MNIGLFWWAFPELGSGTGFFCSLVARRGLRLRSHVTATALCLMALWLTVLPISAAANHIRDALADIASPGQYHIDITARLTPEQINDNASVVWKALPASDIYPLLPGQALWIRFSLQPSVNEEKRLIEISYPALDRASLYTRSEVGQWNEQQAGDLTAVNRWPIPHRHPLLAADPVAYGPTSYLLRIENAHGFSAPIRLINQSEVLRTEQRVSLFLGSYFGLALLGCLVGLGAGLWLRDRVYLYYGLCAALVGLTQAAITGIAGLYLWPDAPLWTDRALVVLATWMLMSMLLLSASIVSLAQRSAMLARLVWLAVIAGAVLSIALVVTDSAIRLTLISPYIVLVLVLLPLVNFWAWRNGDRFGGWLLLSAIPLAASLALAVALYLQWIPLSFATEQGVLGSMALELPAMLAVLILRSQRRRENTRRIRGLDRIDPETGLINEAVFMERMGPMMARSGRLKHDGAVMLIEIVNTDQIQRDFGRKAADELPLWVAERLLSSSREIDSAARLSKRRFGMLLEGPLRLQDAAMIGQRIVARCLMPHEGLHEGRVARVRVAYALVPRHETSVQNLLQRLNERLSMAGPDDRKAVYGIFDTPAAARHSQPLARHIPESA